MKVSKKMVVPVVAVALVGTTIFGVTQVSAQTSSTPNLVQMIAQKFGLDQSQVQAVFDQYKSEKQADMQQKFQTKITKRLDQAVKQGKITSVQERAIMAEIAKLKSEYNLASFKNLTPAERKQLLQKEKAEVDAWAKVEGVNPSYVLFMPGMRRGGKWLKPGSSPTPAPTATL